VDGNIFSLTHFFRGVKSMICKTSWADLSGRIHNTFRLVMFGKSILSWKTHRKTNYKDWQKSKWWITSDETNISPFI
jgi:hypothetical protein